MSIRISGGASSGGFSSAAPLPLLLMQSRTTKLASCRGETRKKLQLSHNLAFGERTMWLELRIYNDVGGIAVASKRKASKQELKRRLG